MTTTLNELKEHLKDIEETTFLEMFDISTEELVERFSDKIEDKYDELIKEYGNESN
jgi:hypothetical protein